MLQPGSLTTVSTDDGDDDRTVNRYWRPVHRPSDRSHSYYADRLAALIERAAAERTDETTEYGLLLSGGSDSRLTLAALESVGCSANTYHINDWVNDEAEVAKRAAQAVDAEFTFLQRDEGYQARSLASTPSVSTFGGYFNQSHAVGFEERLRSDVDVLFTGHYGDMLFKGNHLPKPPVDLGPLGSFELPMESACETVEEFVEHRTDEAPAYLDDALDRSIHDLYRSNVTQRGDRIVDHGVEFESLREAVLCSRCPLTNGTSHFFYYGTEQLLPSGTLFLDNRLIDLFLEIPIESLVRGNLINRAIDRLSPELAAIPHGETGVALKHPFEVHWLGSLATSFKRNQLPSSTPSARSTHGPWPNHAELIRSHPFVRETIDEHEPLIRALPFLSWEKVNECYEAHLLGENNVSALYTLITFLEMPVTKRVAKQQTTTTTDTPRVTSRELVE
ncbi:asparagine synthase-related protein [Natronosalvus caseinilyticus]|uniref:asparagine synthase-related protein n=1 Tax=Natronosalvus caseinilyticus TaxID=2953747 RepID=UPI0028AF15E5|nr:asparagine synthase-related protein [Natronosalvus caseinilyticus]